MSASPRAALVHRFFELAAARDAPALAELMADDAVSYDPIDADPVIGRHAHQEMFASVDDLFADVAFDVEVLAEHARFVIVRWSATCELADGRGRTRFGGVDSFAVDNDQVSGHWAFWDPDDIERGIGSS